MTIDPVVDNLELVLYRTDIGNRYHGRSGSQVFPVGVVGNESGLVRGHLGIPECDETG